MITFRRQKILFFLFFLFIIQTTIWPYFMPNSWYFHLSSNLVYTAILLVAIYDHSRIATLLGIGFGLLQDVVFYGDVIGPQAFSMGLCVYIIGFFFHRPRLSALEMGFVIIIGTILMDILLFVIYKLFHLHHLSLQWVFVRYMLPNLCIHFVFALMIYVPLRKQLQGLKC